MKYRVQHNRILWLVAIGLALLTGCSREVEPTPKATPTARPPFDVTYCDIDPTKICLEGFGLETDERLMALFIVTDKVYTDIYVRADGPDGEIRFECQESENFAGNVYCIGEPYPEGDLIKMNIYSNKSNKLLAIGVFNVVLGELPESDIIFYPTTTAVPPPTSFPETSPTSSPVPSYQNPVYPNPSYNNPTSLP
jgi:hypothetical protein